MSQSSCRWPVEAAPKSCLLLLPLPLLLTLCLSSSLLLHLPLSEASSSGLLQASGCLCTPGSTSRPPAPAGPDWPLDMAAPPPHTHKATRTGAGSAPFVAILPVGPSSFPWGSLSQRPAETLSPTLLLDGGKQGLEAGGGEGDNLSRLFPSAPCREGGGGASCF